MALPYALLYGSVPARIHYWIYAAKQGDGLPDFNKKVRNRPNYVLDPPKAWGDSSGSSGLQVQPQGMPEGCATAYFVSCLSLTSPARHLGHRSALEALQAASGKICCNGGPVNLQRADWG